MKYKYGDKIMIVYGFFAGNSGRLVDIEYPSNSVHPDYYVAELSVGGKLVKVWDHEMEHYRD